MAIWASEVQAGKTSEGQGWQLRVYTEICLQSLQNPCR